MRLVCLAFAFAYGVGVVCCQSVSPESANTPERKLGAPAAQWSDPLKTPVSATFSQTHFLTALRSLFRSAKLNFEVDSTLRGTVTGKLEKVPLATALTSLLQPIQATWRPVYLKGSGGRFMLSSVQVLPSAGQRGRLVDGNPEIVFMRPNPKAAAKLLPVSTDEAVEAPTPAVSSAPQETEVTPSPAATNGESTGDPAGATNGTPAGSPDPGSQRVTAPAAWQPGRWTAWGRPGYPRGRFFIPPGFGFGGWRW